MTLIKSCKCNVWTSTKDWRLVQQTVSQAQNKRPQLISLLLLVKNQLGNWRWLQGKKKKKKTVSQTAPTASVKFLFCLFVFHWKLSRSFHFPWCCLDLSWLVRIITRLNLPKPRWKTHFATRHQKLTTMRGCVVPVIKQLQGVQKY